MSYIDEIFKEALTPFLEKGLGFKTTNVPGFPKIEVSKQESNLVIRAIVAGYKKSDIQLSFKNDLLTIQSVKSEDTMSINGTSVDKIGKGLFYTEFKQSAFRRDLYINSKLVDVSEMDAALEDGILTITIPYKTKEETPDQVIKIK